MLERQYSLIDRILIEAEAGMATLMSRLQSSRPNPSQNIHEDEISLSQKKHSAGLMRVNHTGEVCAQALYRGQMMTARKNATREILQQACTEEVDHLAWTHDRLTELNGHRSYLNFFWYTYSFILGLLAGSVSDQWSLGFVEETEKQVSDHLTNHLAKISQHDKKSRAIIEMMREDEEHHGMSASKAGASPLPMPAKKLMQLQSKIMTTLAYWI